jgi:hypothetical protein
VTASLPAEVRSCFQRFITTEFTTVDRRQQPITWPVTPYYTDGAPTIDISTGLGYPKKADDAKRNRHVSLLFSDPTGCGVETKARVLVQGTATVDDRDLDANAERYFRESGAKLPATRKMHPPAPLRKPLAWYYTRIYVKVRPERVFVWPDGDPTKPPDVLDAHMEEVRAGHSTEPAEPHEPAAARPIIWDERIHQLGTRHPMAVVSWVGPDGFPISVRMPVRVDRDARRLRLGTEPSGLPLAEGRACLVAHAHAEDFTWQENFQVRGDLVRDGDGWALTPQKLIGGFELPKGLGRYRTFLTRHWRFYRTASRRRRELTRR